MNEEYEYQLFEVENDVQDRNSIAWHKLCEYVEKIAKEGTDEFSPREYLGEELFSQIYTLPEIISKLKKVKKIWLYGSKLKRIPPEIGEMEALEYFDPYTSYYLHWFPYEITNCKKLKNSRVSTRALYGNYKHRRPFPDLTQNHVRYEGNIVKCSVCKKEITYQETNQLWISLSVGKDVLPLLVNLCSKDCETRLPVPPEDYIRYPHKGGKNVQQPPDEDEIWEQEDIQRQAEKTGEEVEILLNETDKKQEETSFNVSNLPLLKLIKKIWEK